MYTVSLCSFVTVPKSVKQNKNNNNNNNNNTLIYIAPACRMTSEALADSSSRATEMSDGKVVF